MKRDGNIEENRKYLRSMEESARNYYEIKKGISKPKLPKHRIHFDDINKDKELNKVNARRKRDELRPALIKQNKLYYFGPAQTAIEITEAGLDAYQNGNVNLAREKLEQALEHYVDNTDLSFNLGKFYLETGMDIATGLEHLIEYYLVNYNNYYSLELKKLLHITGKKKAWQGYIDNGEYEVRFEINDEMIYFDEIPEGFSLHIPLDFIVPIPLYLERRDKENIEMMDYKYLRKLVPNDGDGAGDTYEITINKASFKSFIKEFYGTILELSDQRRIKDLITFNELHLELLEYENYDPGQLGEPREIAFWGWDSQLVSLVQVRVTHENSSEFLDLFKGFAQKHLINEKSDKELDQEEDEWEERQQDEYDSLGRFEMEQMLHDDYDYYEGQSRLYGEVSVILYNLENEIPEPYERKNERIFTESRTKYLAIFGDVFDLVRFPKTMKGSITLGGNQLKEKGIKKGNVSPDSQLTELLSEVKSEKVRNILTAQFDDIIEILEKKSHLTMVPMRMTLELILQESSMKLGVNLSDGGRKKTLFQLIEETKRKNKYPRSIDAQMFNIRTMANSSLHYNALEEYATISKQEVKELFEQLINIVNYFVRKFRL